jgi:hypothetical protein
MIFRQPLSMPKYFNARNIKPAYREIATRWPVAINVFAILADQFFGRIKFPPPRWLTGVNTTRA